MTFEVVCSKCGTPLYSGFDLKSAKDVLKNYGGRCKGCGTPLSIRDFSVEVLRLE